MPRGIRDRRADEARGRKAERIAAWWLRAKGYRVVAMRVRTAAGEIDLIVRRGRTIAAVEVKRRADFASALHAVTPRQRQRIAGALAAWLAARPGLTHLQPRFDVLVIGAGRPRHLPGAWVLDDRQVATRGW